MHVCRTIGATLLCVAPGPLGRVDSGSAGGAAGARRSRLSWWVAVRVRQARGVACLCTRRQGPVGSEELVGARRRAGRRWWVVARLCHASSVTRFCATPWPVAGHAMEWGLLLAPGCCRRGGVSLRPASWPDCTRDQHHALLHGAGPSLGTRQP